MKNNENIRLKKAVSFFNRVNDKAKFHYKKYQRARKCETIDLHYDAYRFYSDLSSRVTTLIFSLRRNDKFGSGRNWWEVNAQEYKKRKLQEKENRKQEFENNYRVFLHFFQNSLRADYGTWICDKCARTYYHSPSDVYLGTKKKYESCCGHCVNTLMIRNGQDEVYV